MRRWVVLLLAIATARPASAAEPMKTESLDFQFNGKRLSGTLDLPADRPPSAIVVFVLGHGKTDVVAGRWYYDLRSRFVEAGLGCYLWDKAGCGKSEGEYDHDQTVQSSAPGDVGGHRRVEASRHRRVRPHRPVGHQPRRLDLSRS